MLKSICEQYKINMTRQNFFYIFVIYAGLKKNEQIFKLSLILFLSSFLKPIKLQNMIYQSYYET